MSKAKKKPPVKPGGNARKKPHVPKKSPPTTLADPPPPTLVIPPEEIPAYPEVDSPGARATLGIAVRRDELERIRAVAKLRGMSISALVRASLCNLGLLDTIVAEIEQ